MKVKAIRLVVATLLASSFCLAGIHPGLKEAIDNNDIKKAESLVKKMGVTDVYCPATLSWADAKKIYGNFFIDNPQKMETLCDPAFVSAYDQVACTNKAEVSLCMERIRAIPVSEWQPYLNRMQKNKLQVGTESFEAVEIVKEKMAPDEKKNCAGSVKAQKMLLSQYENELQKGLAQNENFTSSNEGASLQHTTDSLRVEVSKNDNNCRAGVKDVEKIVTKTRARNYLTPALHVLFKYLEGIVAQPFGFEGKNKQLLDSYLQLAGNESEFPTESAYIETITKAYSDAADVDDNLVLASCRLFPKVDKEFHKQFGLELFSCEKTLEKYSVVCNQLSRELKIELPSTINGYKPVSYRCNGESWVVMPAMEYELGTCDKKKKGEKAIVNDKYYGCNGKEWVQLSSEIEYATYGKVCDTSTEGKTIKNAKKSTALVCKSGKWRYRMIDSEQNLIQSRQIGNLVWNVENVSVKTPDSFCPADDEKYCKELSRLYHYEDAKNLCPAGWRLPNTEDVKDLNEAMVNRVPTSKAQFGKYPGAFRDNNGNDNQSKSTYFFWLNEDADGLVAGKAFVKNGVERATSLAVEESSWGLPIRCVRE